MTPQPNPSGAWPAGQAPALPFSGATLDRVADLRRDPEAIRELLSAPSTVVVGAAADRVLIDHREPPRLLRLPVVDLSHELVDPTDPILLGIEDGVAVFAADLGGAGGELDRAELSTGRLVALREFGPLFDDAEGGLAAYMVALLGWHRRHRFCANCGVATQLAEAGLSRRCPGCGTAHFPRTDPVVIMLVEHDRHVLLGRRLGSPEGRYSILAGFVSSGETPEAAVIREVSEETTVVAHSPRYIAAQPWPFPSQLMLGYEASADGGEPVPQPGELLDARWFSVEEVANGLEGANGLLLPGKVAIARMLLDGWVARGGQRL